MNQEKITVLMSVYNEPENFLRQAVDSILNQTYRNFEFIIILDKPDNLVADHVLEEYAARDPRIRFYRNDHNIGLAMSLNRGIELAQCDIIARMDADDISLPERFEKEILFLKEHPEVRLLSPNRIGIDENGNQNRPPLNLPKDLDKIKSKEYCMELTVHSGIVYFKSDLLEIGGYRNFPAAQDRDLWLRYLSKGWKIGFLDECLILYRTTSTNTTMHNSLRQLTCVRYAHKLFHERQKRGKDSFSEGNLRAFLDKAGCNDPEHMKNYSRANQLIFDARLAFARHEYLSGTRDMLKAFYLRKAIVPDFSYSVKVRYMRNVVIPRVKRND